MRSWQLQEAKARLSELVKAAMDGPQEITVRGKPAVVMLSRAEFDKLTGATDEPHLVDFLLASPLRGANLDFARDKDATTRDLGMFEDEK